MYISLHAECLFFWSEFYQNWIASTNVSRDAKYKVPGNGRMMGVALMYEERDTVNSRRSHTSASDNGDTIRLQRQSRLELASVSKFWRGTAVWEAWRVQIRGSVW